MNNGPDRLDEILDEALAGYSRQEPSPFLDEKVLPRVRGAAPRRWLWWGLAVAFAAAALLVMTRIPRVQISPPVSEPAAASVRPPTVVIPAVAHVARRTVPRRPLSVRAPLPRRDVFPAPSPLLPEERALMEWSSRFPDRAKEALIDAARRRSLPVTITTIEIPPISAALDQ